MMKTPFEFTLEGKDWWKPFLPVWAANLIYMGVSQVSNTAQKAGVGSAFVTLGVFIAFLAMLAVASAFAIIILRIALPRLSIGEKRFEFRGEVGRFVGMMFLGVFLTVITLGIYLPWFVKRLASYLCSETRFGGETPEFLGKPIKLLLIYLPFLLVMAAIIVVVIFVTLGSDLAPGELFGGYESSGYGFHEDLTPASGMSFVASIIAFFFVLLLYIPFTYLTYRWYVNFSCGGATISWKTSFWPSCVFILGQACLTIITIGIYWPAATLRLYSYFAQRTVIEREGRDEGKLGFEGPIGEGFGLLWGQALLCIITLGFYIPWGYAKVGKWILENSYYEEGVIAAA